MILPDWVGEEPEPWTHLRIPDHQIISSCWDISHLSLQINQFRRSTCSSTCRTCPVHRPRCWKLCPRPSSGRRSASISISIRINITNGIHPHRAKEHQDLTPSTWTFTFTLEKQQPILPGWSPCLALGCNDFPSTFHMDFLGLITRISLNPLVQISFFFINKGG